MKSVFFFFCLLLSAQLFSQTTERVKVEGEINVPANAQPAGITVYNLNSNVGTVTDEEGNFVIDVAVGDSLHISAVQYQPFTVIVDKGVIAARTLNIHVQEAVNVLDEVIVRPYDLSGNVSVDIQRVEEPFAPSLPPSEEMTQIKGNYRPKVENIAMDDPYIKNGIQFVNIFKAIFLSEDSKRRNSPETK